MTCVARWSSLFKMKHLCSQYLVLAAIRSLQDNFTRKIVLYTFKIVITVKNCKVFETNESGVVAIQ